MALPAGEAWVRDSGAAPGQRATLLLLHGWAVTADLNFFPAYRRLADEYRVVAFDQRGHGRGLRPPNGVVHLRDSADDAVAVLDVLGIDRCVPLGYSMGGAVAQLLWKQHRDRVEGLVLCATARHFQGGPLSDVWYRSQGWLAPVADRLDGPAKALLAARVDRRVSDGEHAEWMRAELLGTQPAAALSAMASVGRFRSTSWIGDVDVPTAVVVHQGDRTVPTRRQRGLAAAIPGAARFDIAGGHDAIITNHLAYVPVLAEACDSVAGRLEPAGGDPSPTPGSPEAGPV